MSYDPPIGLLTGREKKLAKKAKYGQGYPEPIKSRREELKKLMMNEPIEIREIKVRAKNMEFFDEDYNKRENMYSMVIEMMKAMPDKTKSNGESLAKWYLEDFDLWLQKSGREKMLRDEFLKDPIIRTNALKACHVEQKTLLSRIFDISQETLMKDVTELLQTNIAKGEFIKAARLAVKYQLSDTLDFGTLARPLITSGQNKEAYELMQGCKRMQIDFVKFLDEFVGMSRTAIEQDLLQYEDKHGTVSSSKFGSVDHDKLISSVLSKVSLEYNFERDLAKYAPNHAQNASFKNLKHKISQRYPTDGAKQEMSDENYFQDMVATLQNHPDVQEQILFYLWSSNVEMKQIDAISIAIHLEINDKRSKQIPGKMRDFFGSEAMTEEQQKMLKEARILLEKRTMVRTPQENEQLYVYEDNRCPIYMITTESEMKNLCTEIQLLSEDPKPVYVGFDSEWKPSNLTSINSSKIAIIQLYFKDKVYLVDCVQLEEKRLPDERWQEFARQLFGSKNLKIIGFDMRNDLDAIIALPALRETLAIDSIQNCFDLKRLAENICEIDMEILDLKRKTFKLADLTQSLLGQTLDKTEQCSNWQSRPLRKNQLLYAALDAVVVVLTFEKILEITLEKNSEIDIIEIRKHSNVLAPKKEKCQKAHRKLKNIPWLEICEVLSRHCDKSRPFKRPHEMKVIVDTMLLGFGKHLRFVFLNIQDEFISRRIGVDVYLPRDVADFKDKLKLINRLGGDYRRLIITVPSKSFTALREEYARDLFAMPELNNKPPMDQLIDFCDKFNVEVRPEDEYLCCIECNSRLQIKFPGPVLHFLHQYNVIHVQNVYRADMSQFPLEDWWNRMLQLNPDNYDGIVVKMSRPTPKSKWIVATVPTGCLHITRQTVIHNNLPDGVEVKIQKVPDDEFQRPNLCFYVCGDCGTVAYDGRASHQNSKTSQSNDKHLI
ncbi:CRE-MUT-7 protein [Caenorhabditis remanei]|uniref:CRE-MUT-7 protein n=1 Tax=Caenorhabditis remanei TaxID=31234 RepID=E3LSD6_CAERE|nr:CRE-MUT-7 protein [Caenorhabditis remanei]